MDDFIKVKDEKTTSTFIVGGPGYGKTTILEEFKSIYKDLGWKVFYIDSLNLIDSDFDIPKYIREELDQRYEILKENKVNSYKRLEEPFEKMVLIIDDLKSFVDKSNNEDVLQNIQRIGSMGRSVGINLVFSAQNTNDISQRLFANTLNRIYLGLSALEVRPTPLAFGTLAYVNAAKENAKPILFKF